MDRIFCAGNLSHKASSNRGWLVRVHCESEEQMEEYMSLHHLLGWFHCYSSQYMCLRSPVGLVFFFSHSFGFYLLGCQEIDKGTVFAPYPCLIPRLQ